MSMEKPEKRKAESASDSVVDFIPATPELMSALEETIVAAQKFVPEYRRLAASKGLVVEFFDMDLKVTNAVKTAQESLEKIEGRPTDATVRKAANDALLALKETLIMPTQLVAGTPANDNEPIG